MSEDETVGAATTCSHDLQQLVKVAMEWFLVNGTSWSTRVLLLLAYCVASVPWVRIIAATWSPGPMSFLGVLPVLVINTVAPLTFRSPSEILSVFVVSFVLTWLSSFKVLALCLNRGPLAQHRNDRFVPFALYMLLPLLPEDPPVTDKAMSEDGEVAAELLDRWHWRSHAAVFIAKTALLAVVARTLSCFDLPDAPRDLLYAFGLYALLGLVMDGPASVGSALFGVRLATHFDRPWLSRSLGDFWGRRWNRVAAASLKSLVFDPLSEGRLIKDPSTSRKTKPGAKGAGRMLRILLGVQLTFTLSGLIHASVMWYFIGQFGWKWMAFFCLQGPLVVFEKIVIMRLWPKIPVLVGILYTMLVLETCGRFLFIGEAEAKGLHTLTVNAILELFS